MALRSDKPHTITTTVGRGNQFEVIGYRVDTPPGSRSVTLFPQLAQVSAVGERESSVRLPERVLSQDEMDALFEDVGLRYETLRARDVDRKVAIYQSHRDAIYALLQALGVFPTDATS